MHNKNLYTDFTSFSLLKTEVYQSHKWVTQDRKIISSRITPSCEMYKALSETSSPGSFGYPLSFLHVSELSNLLNPDP